MEFRKYEKTRIIEQIKKYENYISENEESIKKSVQNPKTKTHINNLLIKNTELKSKISTLEERLHKLNIGDLDTELLEKNTKSSSHTLNGTKITHQEYENTFLIYQNVKNTIPEYMIKKIKNTPNNKGYIWKGIWFFGELPEEKGKPIVFFDKQRDGTLIIHEFSERNYKIWHKKENQDRTLFMNKIRKQVKLP